LWKNSENPHRNAHGKGRTTEKRMMTIHHQKLTQCKLVPLNENGTHRIQCEAAASSREENFQPGFPGRRLKS
jgi:hypothetical protein